MKEGQIEEEEVVPEGMPTLEDTSLIYIELGEKCNADMQLEMLETMRSIKEDLEILKVENLKLMNAKSNQEEVNELILRSLTDPQKNNGQNSCGTGKKEKRCNTR